MRTALTLSLSDSDAAESLRLLSGIATLVMQIFKCLSHHQQTKEEHRQAVTGYCTRCFQLSTAIQPMHPALSKGKGLAHRDP